MNRSVAPTVTCLDGGHPGRLENGRPLRGSHCCWFRGQLWDIWCVWIAIRQWCSLFNHGDAVDVRGRVLSQALNRKEHTKSPALFEGLSKPGFLNLSTTDIWGWIILSWRLFCALYDISQHVWPLPLDASTTSPLVLMTTNVSWHCPMSLTGLNGPQLRTPDLN